ncbi:hypothetical protein BJ875DRAFT_443164 [Amylocarpus encephaloides]|uniref:Uncharacterized protein n=1 Tax=Amylocarpus encephaloides TaxID=45428 RepID=A0A9P7YG38_9HELO|nr:hypothetical protein BJ875DRAFT_443164 [Amylocarpus encephaloides]
MPKVRQGLGKKYERNGPPTRGVAKVPSSRHKVQSVPLPPRRARQKREPYDVSRRRRSGLKTAHGERTCFFSSRAKTENMTTASELPWLPRPRPLGTWLKDQRLRKRDSNHMASWPNGTQSDRVRGLLKMPFPPPNVQYIRPMDISSRSCRLDHLPGCTRAAVGEGKPPDPTWPQGLALLMEIKRLFKPSPRLPDNPRSAFPWRPGTAPQVTHLLSRSISIDQTGISMEAVRVTRRHRQSRRQSEVRGQERREK